MKEILKYITIGLLGLILISLNYYGGKFIYKEFIKEEKLNIKCGTVVNGMDKTRKYKSNIYNDLYLGVKYDDGVFEALEVSPTLYMSKTIGDRVCFERNDDFCGNPFIDLLGFLGFAIIIIEILMGLILFLTWVFD